MDVKFHNRFSLMRPAITEIRHALKHVLDSLNVSVDDIDASALVITEYLTNLLRHASAEDRTITLLIGEKDNHYTVALIDDLEPYNLFELNHSSWTIESESLAEGGMGVALIRHYFPKASYKTLAGKNHFSFNLNKIKRKTTLLYVDDDITQLSLVEAYVQDEYTFIACQNCHDAWQLITQSKVDILLLDYKLKGDTSETLLAQLAHSDLKTTLAILMLTGDSDIRTVKKLNRFGIDDYITKPVMKEQLLLNLDRVQNKLKPHLFHHRSDCKQTHYDLGQMRSAHLFGTITTNLGGDFFIPLDNDNKGFILGDIMGHGLSANQKSYEIQGFISGFTSSYSQVDTLVDAMNLALSKEKICKGSLLTMLVVYFDDEYIYFYNAGHPPPIAVMKNGCMNPLLHTDPLMGLSTDHSYRKYQYPLKDIAQLIFYTDGWVDNLGSTLNEEKQIMSYLPDNSLKGEAYATKLWLNSQGSVSKEFDDASLIVIN
ncbi:Regulator of RpoS [Pseudoalteromonas holothuriae]|uniref:Regulator of RpoS n=1 Tax=Pseudoalteromonas holothuriae TaxID=2963714 RepID=A0A9W4R1A2_9GAMM|nr:MULTISPECIES: SpoIIE family protein phosphatase [unclassified Pseudoalteromonas]CAH9061932.1 Regulator of RpoS [Pseudoalteromonas sp. CIP111951]CAH9062222.1 Regulator of RpoS [Pseudoalteromonas sp. CIP111854]